MSVDLSIDIETLGRGPTTAPLSIGWASFDPRGTPRDIKASGTIYVDLQSSLDAGLTVDGSTIQWWMGQADYARHGLFPDMPPAESLGGALLRLHQVFMAEVGKDGMVWAKGPSFDVAILEHAYIVARTRGLYSCGSFLTPWKYNHVRDVRTIMMAASLSDKGRPENSHNAREDAVAQAAIVQEAFACLKQL